MVAAAVAPSRQRSVIICSFIQYKCRHIGADTRRQLLIDWIFASEHRAVLTRKLIKHRHRSLLLSDAI